MIDEPVLINAKDMRAIGLCKDVKIYFFDKHGLDWRRFVRKGMTKEELSAPGENLTAIERAHQAAIKRLSDERR